MFGHELRLVGELPGLEDVGEPGFVIGQCDDDVPDAFGARRTSVCLFRHPPIDVLDGMWASTDEARFNAAARRLRLPNERPANPGKRDLDAPWASGGHAI